MTAAITLTRVEAAAVGFDLLEWTAGHLMIMSDENTVENFDEYQRTVSEMEAAIHRLRLEATIRESGGWWGDRCPGVLDSWARCGKGECPESFTLCAEGAAALAELCADQLLDAIAWVDRMQSESLPIDAPYFRGRRAVLESLAARFGVEIPTAVA